MNKINLKISLQEKIENFISSFLLKRLSRSWLLDARQDCKLFYISEIKNFFDNSEFFCFGSGGSVANLQNIEVIKKKNIIASTYVPYYFQKLYNIKVNFWPISYGPVVDYVLQLEEEEGFKMDLSETFIIIPSVESNTKVNILSASIKRLRKKHPEAIFVLCHRMEASVSNFDIPNFFLKKGIEPLLCYDDNTLHNIFIPHLAYLGASKAFFSGIDLIPTTGHFWDRKLVYQSMKGLPLKFPNDEKLEIGKNIMSKALKNLKIYRLEKNETRLTNYPFKNLSEVVQLTKDRPAISKIISEISPILFNRCF